jgi:hypothetical protein
MAKSATMPSNSTIRACSLAADEEKMIHEEQLLLRENPQECQNQQHIPHHDATGSGKKFTD